MPGVYDALTARLAEQAGFQVGFVSGYAVSAARLAAPDLGYLGQAEMAETARGVCLATTAPLLVDADTGYGNALSAIRTVRLLHDAGAAGLFLEDQVWPKRCGHMRASASSRATSGWRNCARWWIRMGGHRPVRGGTHRRARGGLARRRHRAWRAAMQIGADAMFVEAPQSIDELEQIAAATPGAAEVANMVEGGRRRY